MSKKSNFILTSHMIQSRHRSRPRSLWQQVFSPFVLAVSLLMTIVPTYPALAQNNLATIAHLAASSSVQSWPNNQVLPQFCCITGQLDEISTINMNDEQNILFITLQGLINRTQPRIYVQQPAREDPTLWLNEMHLTTHFYVNPYDLIIKYSKEIAGMVIYDPSMPDTINLATTIAGAQGGIVASPNEAARLSQTPYRLTTLVDLRANQFTSAEAVYQYTRNYYWSQPQAEHRLIIGLRPGPSGLRDYAIATRATVIWLDAGSSDPAQKTLLDSFYQNMNPGSSYLGWYPNEMAGVQDASSHGIATYAADLSQNLTILSTGSRMISRPVFQRPLPLLQNKIYVAMFMSDGDNIQIDQHLLAQKWADPQRGSVPIGWTIDPILVDVAPAILNYYWRTATANDELVAGPSGLGYVLPDQLPNPALDIYAAQSARYLNLAGLDIATVWNTTNVMPERVGDAYARHSLRRILGLTTQKGLQLDQTGPRIYANSLVSLSMGNSYAHSENELESTIENIAFTYRNNRGPIFLPIQGDLNSPGISPTTLNRVQQFFRYNPNVVFVGPEELFRLFAASHTNPYLASFPATGIRP